RGRSSGEKGVVMDRYLLRRQSNLFYARGLCQYVILRDTRTLPLMERNSALQVRQGESRLAISAIGRTDQLEERLVLRDWKELSFAKHPAGGGEVPREYPDFSDVRLSHKFSP